VVPYVAVKPEVLAGDGTTSSSHVHAPSSPVPASATPTKSVDASMSPVATPIRSPSPPTESKLEENVSPSKAIKGQPTKIAVPVVTWDPDALPDHAEGDCVVVIGGHDGTKRDPAAYCLQLNPFAAWTSEEPVVSDPRSECCACACGQHCSDESRCVAV
jgi:hypothetical protein